MPPPKPKLYKPEKLKTIKKPQQHENMLNSSNHIQFDSESDRKFETEIAWCIQAMENSLNGGKLNANQAADATKTIKLLKSSNHPIIRKRQIMRMTFGDYRAKMAEEEKKLRLGSRQIQFSNQSSSKSFFVKRSVLSTIGKDKDFKFNFSATTDIPFEQLHLNDSSKDIDKFEDKSAEQKNGSTYTSTDNSFRFNFEIVEETVQ